MNPRLSFMALLLASSIPLVASAQEQPWVADPDIGEGIGIAVGDFELHPSFAAEFGYDSNYLKRGEQDLGADGSQLPIIESLRLRLTPSLTFSTARAPRSETAPVPLVRFRVNTTASAAYNVFIPLDDTDEFRDRNRLGGGIGAGFEVLPQRPITWDVNASYRRTVEPSSVATGEFDFDRHTLGAGTGVTWRPGGGLFEWRVGYDFKGTYFSEADYDGYNNAQHTIGTKGRWRFLPRTAFLYDGDYRLVRYFDGGAEQFQREGDSIRSRLGIAGLITSRLAFRVMGGWAASFYEPVAGLRQNYDGPVGNAELKWYMTPAPSELPGAGFMHLSWVALGYAHAYAHSYLGPFYTSDRGYLTLKYFIGNAVAASLQGYVAYNSYPDFIYVPNGEPQRGVNETRLGGELFAEYRLANNIAINTTIGYDRNISDDAFPLVPNDTADPPDRSQDGLEYDRFQAFAGVRVFW